MNEKLLKATLNPNTHTQTHTHTHTHTHTRGEIVHFIAFPEIIGHGFSSGISQSDSWLNSRDAGAVQLTLTYLSHVIGLKTELASQRSYLIGQFPWIQCIPGMQ